MRNLTFKAAMLNDSRTTVNRQSTDGQSQRHYKQTPLSKRWKVLMTLVFLFTFAIGNVWAADITVTPPTPNNASNPFSTGLYVMSFSGTGSKLSSGAITTGTKGAVITINFQATKSDMYIKTITFNSLGNGTLSSGDGTFDGQVFTATGNKNSVNVVLTSGSGQKGTVKVTNVVVNTGTNVVETITFTGVDSGDGQKATFTSSAATSALSSITTDASAFSVSSGKLSWANGKKVILTAESNIKYVAFSIADGKMYESFSAAETTYNSANYSWSGSSKTVTLTNGSGGGREIKGLYVIIDPVVKHHVTYSLGGDYGTTPTQADVAEGGKFTLHNGTTGITAPENKTFAGWSDGTTTYEGGAEYTMGDDDVTLTAQWATSYDISYDKGAYGTGEIAGGKKAEGVAYTLSSSMFTRENYLQVGWTKTDGTSREYMIGGSYTTNAAQTFYPAWAEKDTYVAAFHYDSENPTTPPAGWTFANAGTYTNTSATVAYVGKFTAEGETTASGKSMDPNHIAFAKNADADAVYDLGYVTTVSAVAGTLMIGSTSAKVASIDYLAADGSTVLHSFNITHNKADWGANNFNETEVVPNVRYIRINGKDFWQVLGAFSVTYGSLVPKYDLAFAKNGGSGADMTTLRYAEDAVVTLPGCTFTAPTNKTFDAWVVTKTASGNPITVTDGKFTMPAEAVTATATWKFLPKLTLTAGEGATGVDVEAYYAAGTLISVPEKPAGFSNGTKDFTGWVYSQAVTIEADKFAMPSNDLTLTAQWASATAVAQILGGDSYETFADAIAAVAAGKTIQLLADCSYDAAWNLTLAGTVTLDLNGHDLTYNGAGRGVQVHNGAKLILEDGTATTAPTIDLTADPLSRSAITYTSGTFDSKDGMCATAGGEIEINSGTYLATEGVVLVVGNAATVTVNDGVLISRDNGVLMGNGTNSDSYRNYVINVHGGILLGEIVSTGYASMVIYHPNVGELNIDGGTLVSTNGPAVVCRGGESNITGGTIVAQGSGSGKCGDASLVLPAVGVAYDFKSAYPGVSSFDAKISGDANVSGEAGAVKGIYAGATPTTAEEDAVAISGGTFNSSVAQALCAENYAPKDNGDGTYGVKPLATSIDFEALATTHGTGTTDVRSELEAKNYTFSGSISTSNGASWDVATAAKPADKGLKIKGADGATLSFDVAAGKLVTLKVGSLKGGATIAVNGGAAEPLTGSNPLSTGASVYTYYYSADVATYSIATTGTDYDVIQSVTIEDPYVVTFNANGGDEVAAATFYGTALTLPSATKGTEVFKGWYDAAEAGNLIGKAGDSYTPTANVTLHAQWETVSSDNTLSALEVDGVALADFDPEKHIYNIVCEYGHTPEITLATATAAAQGATVTIVNTPEDGDGYKYIQANVIPASGTPIGYNQVRYTNKPKLGVSLIKVTIPNGTGNTQTIEEANITGYIGGTATQKLENGKHKLGSGGHFIGMTLAEGTFQENDIVVVNVETVKADLMRVFKENTAAEANVVASSTANMTVGDNYVLLGETTTNSLYLRRGTDGENYQKDWNPFIGSFEVQRLMDPFIAELKVGDALATIDEEANPKTITIEVPASTDITALTPSIKAYANGGATVTPADPQDFSAGAVEYTVTSYYGETTTYQVTVTKAEASHDATLSALSVAGYSLSPAFDPAVLTYNVELPKGSVIGDLPAVSYTKNHVGATAVKTDATVLPGATTIVVTAEDGLEENKKTYTINFTVSTKDKVVIFDGSTMDAIATSPDASGLSWELVGLSVSSKTIGSYTHAIATGGGTSNTKHIKISVPAKYEAQFEIGQATNSNTKERNALVKTTAKPDDSETLFTVSSSNASEAAVATSGALAGGKDYYLHSDNSINFVKIVAYLDRVSEAPAISAQPAALAACDAATNTNALSVTASVEAGTLSYQWYKVVEEGDDVAVGTNSNEFVPTAVGEYYVVVTNTEGTYKPSSKKSEVVAVSLKPAVEITTAPFNQRAEAGNNATLTVVAANAVNYAWYTCDEDGSNADAVDGASGADKTSLVVAVTEGLQQYYKVVVTDDCGRTDEAIAKVSQFVPATPANVTESIVWDWTSSAWSASGEVQFTNKVADGTDFSKDYELLANADAIVPNNEGFRSDMLYGKGQYVWRSGNKFFQGTAIKFTTTVPGRVRVYFRSTGNNKKVKVEINEALAATYESGDFRWSGYVDVPAGDVEIICTGTDNEKSFTRIQKIEFEKRVDQRGAGWAAAGELGTVCLESDAVVTGANLYELAGLDVNGYLAFDQIQSGELEKGKPYLFEATSNALINFYAPVNAGTADQAEVTNGMHGTFTNKTFTASDESIYYFSGRHIWAVKDFTVSITIPAHYCYVDMSELQNSGASEAPAPGRRRISMSIMGSQIATGIENTGFESEAPRKVLINGELFILRGEKMYDAKGQLVK